MSKKTILIIALAIIIIAGGYWIFARGLKNNKDAPNNREPVVNKNMQKITIAEFGEVFLYAPLYIAQEKGFFKDEGLEVNIVPTGGDEKTFAALLTKDAQFGVADPTFVAVSGEKGQPGKVVASILSGVPFWGVTKNKNISEINQAADLKTYSVATLPAPSTAYTLQRNMFQSAGLKPNIKEVAYGALLPALDSGQVDIALELEPNVSIAVKNGDKIVYSLAKYYPDFALTGLTALPDYIQKNPETVQRTVNAFQKALDYIQENPSDSANLLIKRFPEVQKDVAEKAINNMISARVFPKNTEVSKAGWDTAIKLRKDAGDIKGDASYDSYVVTNFSQKALENR